MDVDEARCDDLADGVDLALGHGHLTHEDDASALDAHVGPTLLGSRAVDDDAVSHGKVDHAALRAARSSAVDVASSSPATITTP